MVLIFTVRKRSCGKIMFSHACVKNSDHGVGGVQPPLWADTPPWADTHPGHPGQTSPETATAVDGTHPNRVFP